MSIASEIARLQQAKADLKTAINNKGGNITTERIDQFASEVASLPSPKKEEERILTPDFSTGNHVIVPTTDKVLRRVTLTKPANLIPENIKKDVDICGVVGTLESGGVPLEQFISFDTDYFENLAGNRLLTFQSRFLSGLPTPVDIEIYYKNGSDEDVLLVSKRVYYDTINFIVIPRSYGNLKIVMSLVPFGEYGWDGFSGFYAKTALPNVVTQLTAPSWQDDFVLSYTDFDVFHVVFTAYGG